MNNRFYTSIEQSKKLLELGLNPESADMCFIKNPHGEFKSVCGTLQYVSDLREKAGYKTEIFPCWSLGALLEVMPKCISVDNYKWQLLLKYEEKYYCKYWDSHYDAQFRKFGGETSIEAAYNMVVWLLKNGYLKKGE